MTKKTWEKPELEVLHVHMTAATTHDGPLHDEAYVAGVRNPNPRFTS